MLEQIAAHLPERVKQLFDEEGHLTPDAAEAVVEIIIDHLTDPTSDIFSYVDVTWGRRHLLNVIQKTTQTTVCLSRHRRKLLGFRG